MPKEGIAIVGLGCRFPGGVNDTESFWKLLVDGREAVRDVPPDRWNVERFYDSEPGLPGKSIAKRGGFLDGIDQFDPQFFGISPREAPYVDPQHRLLLETAWEAIEDAGMILDFEHGTDLGVFVGISHNDYQSIQGTPWEHTNVSSHSPTGTAHSLAANRISYCLNLRGPSVAMDTACSSALTAVQAACDHIWAGRGEAALAGGVTVMISPGGFIGFSQAGMLSPDGHCKAFDASANGFVRGEGAGMVLLKRLSTALQDGDPIHAVILGAAMNQDGHTNGISLPSPEAQARLVRDACTDAEISPLEIGFVEAHGTGTAVGDPIEAHALAEALCKDRADDSPLLIGSVKTNLGHLETAAGLAGLIKAVLVLKHGKIPATLHFREPNPNIDFKALKLDVPARTTAFPQSYSRRIAGVNSFGFGGSNSHVILAEPPAEARSETAASAGERSWPIVLSARSEQALRTTAGRLSAWIQERLNANGSTPQLPDLTYTLGARRNHHPYRISLAARSLPELAEELETYSKQDQSVRIRESFSPRREQDPRIVFVMSGQGPQWWGMGRELMRHEPVFQSAMEACARALRPWTQFSLLEELARDENDSRIHRTEVGQPAIFAMQVSLAALWKSWGIIPAAVVGHSVGEIAAAHVAGILTLDDAARVIALRARFMDGCARGEGAMLAVGLPEVDARALIAKHDRTVTISAFNGPRSLTLAGLRSSLEAMAAELEADGVFARFVKVDHPFHHPMMKPAADTLEETLADLIPHKETIPFFSTVTGARCSGETCTAKHWARGVREPVQFVSAVEAIKGLEMDAWLELSSHPALLVSLQECFASMGIKAPAIGSARRENEHTTLLENALELYRFGAALRFEAMTPSRRLLQLPSYAWDSSRWWSESSDWREGRLAPGGRGMLDLRLPRATPTWIARLDNRHMAFLKDHKVENRVIFPAAGFVEMALEAGLQLFEGKPFVIEDFEIRKPLILSEQPSNLLLELSYDPGERIFTIQSRFDQGAWSVHVAGSLRSERTDTTFAISQWNDSQESLDPVELEGFYGYMSDMGLRYGPEFRPVRELAARSGRSAGQVALSKEIGSRAGEYPLHPVLFDGALQVFSAGAATVEGRKSHLKLPVRFGKILFLRSPGASGRVRARVHECNDEILEGGIGIYEETGKPCVLVDGFRAVSVSGRKAGLPGGARDLVYHLEWERTPTTVAPARLEPVPLAELVESAQQTLNEIIFVRGRRNLEATLAAEDDLAAAHIAAGLREMGVEDAGFTAESLGVIPLLRTVFARMMTHLVARGVLATQGEGYIITPNFREIAESAPDLLRDFLSRHPGHLPEALLCAGNCAQLGAILRGEKDAVQILFSGSGADLLDQFYGDGLFASHWMACIARAVADAARKLPEGRGLRILEVGAGTGGLTTHLLPLLQRGLHTYVFTDVSAAFFPGAMQKLAAFPEVECRVFDIEKPGPGQGLEPESFDFILGTNVIHAVSDVKAALRHLHELLVPGGSLLFMDVATPQLWTESVFGLTSGWWSFQDKELRQEHPLLRRDQWEKVLRDAGFAETASLPGLRGPQRGEGQIGLLARKGWNVLLEEEIPALDETPAEKSWVLFADQSGVADNLAKKIRAAGARCRMVERGGKFASSADRFCIRSDEPQDWTALFQAWSQDAPPERFVYLWTLDEGTIPAGISGSLGTEPLLHLTHALERTSSAAKLRVDLVTRGAQFAGEEVSPVSVGQAAAVGFFRVFLSEHPQYSCRGIDLPHGEFDLTALWHELLRSDAEREVAFRGEARYAQRITRGLPEPERWLDSSVPVRLESRERGVLDALRFAPFALPACGEDEVLVEVRAAGMNFRDVLKALGLYPAETLDARIFGDEVAGIVRAVGANVSHLGVGDRVFGLAVYGLASHTLARATDMRVMPDNLTFEEAATLPVVFMTSWYALKMVARVRKGETVLIHAGAGGVGMAAIQIAHHLGADVIASAGSPMKRSLLATLGVKHVIDSRRSDFVEAIMEITGRRGVDVVLNSLAGEAIPMGMNCLAEFGRFVEIGKRDIYQNNRIPLWPLRKNASFHVVAMDAVFSGDAEEARSLLEDIATLVGQGALRPLPYRSFPASRIDAAFRYMAQGKHIGKVIVAFSESFLPKRGESPIPPFQIRTDGTYVITGAFGGFGKVLSEWLVNCGAKSLVLSSRSGASSPEAETFVTRLRDSGVNVRVVKADAGQKQDVARLIDEARAAGPIRGIFHLAMVIDDAPISALNRSRMESVIRPKAYGAWLLHEATLGEPLDCFVMFSSVSSIFGNPAQANYGAANAFLDALAHHRRAQGLPALAINWGVLGGEGYVARNERVAEFLAKQGTAPLSPHEVMSLMEMFLEAGAAQAAAIRVDWNKWRQFFRGLQENPLLQRIFASGLADEEGSGVNSDWKAKIEAAPPEARVSLITAALKEVVGSVLRVKPDSLRDEQPLTDLGLDSLMGVEIENAIEGTIGVALPPASLMRARTIGQIASLIAEHMGGPPAAAPSTPAPVETALADEVDLDSLSEADIADLVAESADNTAGNVKS